MPFVQATINDMQSRFLALPHRARAVILMLVAMVIFNICVAMIKLLGQRLHVTQIIALRQIFVFAALIPGLVGISRRQSLRINRPGLQILRSTLTFFAILTGFTAIVHLPLATATTLSFTRTFFVTVFAVLILHEVVGPRRIGALIVGFCGVLIIARPQELVSNGLAGLDINLALAVFSSACIAANQILVRIHAKYDMPTVMLGWQSFVIGLAFTPFAYVYWQTPTFDELLIIAFVGLFTSFAQWLMVHAFKSAEATFLAPFDYLRLILSTIIGLYLFSEWPDIFTWIGAAVIFASTFYIVHREAQLKKTNPPSGVGQP